MLKGLNGGFILLRVEKRDAVVVPAHPLLVFVGELRRERGALVADLKGAGLSALYR